MLLSFVFERKQYTEGSTTRNAEKITNVLTIYIFSGQAAEVSGDIDALNAAVDAATAKGVPADNPEMQASI